MEWSTLLPWIGLSMLLCLLVPLALLYWRRVWLARSGGSFPCEVNLGRPGSAHWVLAVARYSGEYLELFRAISLGLKPRRTLRRSVTTARGAGSHSDLVTLGGQRIVCLEAVEGEHSETLELAMDADSATGLLAWLEAAPPSVDRFNA